MKLPSFWRKLIEKIVLEILTKYLNSPEELAKLTKASVKAPK